MMARNNNMAISRSSAPTGKNDRELTVHGSALFPIGAYREDVHKTPIPWHWHPELEAAWVERGQIRLSVGKYSLTVNEGEGYFVNADALHSTKAPEQCELRTLVFHPRLVAGNMESVFYQRYMRPVLNEEALKLVHLTPGNPLFSGMLEHIREAWSLMEREPEGYEFEVRASLSRLIFSLSKLYSARTLSPSRKELRDEHRMKLMLEYIAEHITEEITVEELAAAASIGESECLRCFKATVGTPPIRYLKLLRIEKAAERLAASEEKIEDIAALSGFQDMSYFAKTFREVKGMTPSEYRKNIRG